MKLIQFFLDNHIVILALIIMAFGMLQFYIRHCMIKRNLLPDNELMNRYVFLEMRKRYKKFANINR